MLFKVDNLVETTAVVESNEYGMRECEAEIEFEACIWQSMIAE